MAFLIGAIISVTFLIVKFFEMRFIDKESKPLKGMVKDALLVYFSVLIGSFILGQFEIIVNQGGPIVTPVFTDNPEF